VEPQVDAFLSPYVVATVIGLAGVAFVSVAYGANRLLAPRNPTAEKVLSYESGVDPVGEGWAHTHVRYYVYAFLYVVFAVDVVYLFPWATIFADPAFGAVTLVEMFVFLGFLAAGIVYAVKRGVLTWQ
jgi:NADH-quinone oxidoreductase subunit A